MRRRRVRLVATILGGLLLVYLLFAYVAAPQFWRHYENQPGLAHLPMVTTTRTGIPGDPINIGLVGSRDEVLAAMKAAGWTRPDPVSFRSSAEIAGSVAFRRSYLYAPVSALYYLGRRQDLAFEKEVGDDAARRHHVRLWRVLDEGAEGRPVWLGAATFDKGVGFSHFTGQITHHISGDVDAERNFMIASLNEALRLVALYQISGAGPAINERNGGGDFYWSDGEVLIGVISPDAAAQKAPAAETAPPALTELKDQVWAAVTGTKKPEDVSGR